MVSPAEIPVEQFDELFHGDPAVIEQRFLALRPRALDHLDASLVPQIDSLIALTQAMQGRTDEAFATLDRAEQLPGAQLPMARARLLPERGRVYHQARRMSEALPWMIAAYRLSHASGLDFHAINAAHMAAIVADNVAEKIFWNQRALELAESTGDEKARAWRCVLRNNIGQAFVAAGQFHDALAAFEMCHQQAAERGDALIGRGARWGIARAFRSLGRVGEALSIQQLLLREYNAIERDGSLPAELLGMARGLVFEELAELVPSDSADFAANALRDLSVNDWFRDLEPVRWARIQQRATGPVGDGLSGGARPPCADRLRD